MLEGIRSRVAVTMCFLFGHLYYEQGRFTGTCSQFDPVLHTPVPVMEIRKTKICPRCGKELNPKIKTKKGEK